MLEAIGALDVLDATALYWAGRLTLCGNPDDLVRYDAAFAAFFGGERPRPTMAPVREQQRQLAVAAPLEPAGEDSTAEQAPELAAQASAAEVLRHRDVSELT